jgi:hypothetical protein
MIIFAICAAGAAENQVLHVGSLMQGLLIVGAIIMFIIIAGEDI